MTPDDNDVAELRDLMRAAGMLPPVPVHLADDVDARERLLAQILTEATGSPAAPVPAPVAHPGGWSGKARRRPSAHLPSRPRRRSLALVVAGTFALVAFLGAQLSSGQQALAGTPPALIFSEADPLDVAAGAAPSATQTLADLADVAQSAPQASGAGEVQRIVTYSWGLEIDGGTDATSVIPTQSTWWLAPDGAIHSLQHRTDPVRPDGTIDPTATPSHAAAVTIDDFPAASFDAGYVNRLSRDPDTLTADLMALVGSPTCGGDATRASCLFTAVQQLYSQYVVPGDLAGAIWSCLAAQTGVADLGSTTDRFGRSGIAVALVTAVPHAVAVLVISPATGQLLSAETITLSDPALEITVPIVTSFTMWSSSSFVVAAGD